MDVCVCLQSILFASELSDFVFERDTLFWRLVHELDTILEFVITREMREWLTVYKPRAFGNDS